MGLVRALEHIQVHLIEVKLGRVEPEETRVKSLKIGLQKRVMLIQICRPSKHVGCALESEHGVLLLMSSTDTVGRVAKRR